ncbi:hypothetical protein HYALB_00007203 [Hymenoscyphus albidus]|uniref:Uncharacterized protein n=1 Tax=Hymenoscyphus albidus TaxID=595503 RepID=A0A9N9LCS0_9HELO|nr:hypothetical protein HYALB_00007203 [Hymenoscyphus albidus]
MTSANSTSFINTPVNSEAPRFRSRSPVVMNRLTQTYPLLDHAIKGEENYQETWNSHQQQLFHEINALAKAHVDSETTIEELRNTRPPNGGLQATLRSPFHPDPLEFSGEDPKELPSFLRKLQLKLRMNNDWWTSEQQRMGYVISLLSSKAYNQVAHVSQSVSYQSAEALTHVEAIQSVISQSAEALTYVEAIQSASVN